MRTTRLKSNRDTGPFDPEGDSLPALLVDFTCHSAVSALVENVRLGTAAKDGLPAFTPSTLLHSRDGRLPLAERIVEYNGVLCLDIDADGLGGMGPAEQRDKLAEDPHVFAALLSPSGTGVKAFIRRQPNEHGRYDWKDHGRFFSAAERYFSKRHGVKIDRAPRNPASLCYFTWDPDGYVQTESFVPFPVEDWVPPPPTERSVTTKHPLLEGDDLRPGDWFNKEHGHDWCVSALEDKGWKVARRLQDRTHLTRPDKDRGISATVFEDGTTYVFSTSQKDLPVNKGIGPFSLFTFLEHGGDFRSSATSLTDHMPSGIESVPGVAARIRREMMGAAAGTTPVIEDGEEGDPPDVWDPDAVFTPQPPRILFREVEVAHVGNMVTVASQAGVGKSSLVAAGMATSLSGQPTLGWSRPVEDREHGAVIHIDTEQSEEDWHRLNNIVRSRSGLNSEQLRSRYYSLSLVEQSPASAFKRMEELFDWVAERQQPIHSIWIDGPGDLIPNSNDMEASAQMRAYFHAIARRLECVVFFVMHLNPGGDAANKMQGHLGTQLERKSETVLQAAYSDAADEPGVVHIWAKKTRREPILRRDPFKMVFSKADGYHIEATRLVILERVAERLLDAYRDGVTHLKSQDIMDALAKYYGMKAKEAEGVFMAMREEGLLEGTPAGYRVTQSIVTSAR